MLTRRSLIASSAAACASLCVGPAGGTTRPLTIFAAASLKTALDALMEPLATALGTPARTVFAASSALARQIEQGAPADLFWSADREWMAWCATRNLVRRETITDLLGNELVVIAPATSTLTALPLSRTEIERALGAGRLAMGETRSVPAGRYGKEALQALQLWDALSTRLAETDHVRAALLLVARGEAPLGIVYASDAQAEPRVKIIARIPATAHKPIIYPLAITTTAQSEAAIKALKFFQSSTARAIFIRDGFSVLTPTQPS